MEAWRKDTTIVTRRAEIATFSSLLEGYNAGYIIVPEVVSDYLWQMVARIEISQNMSAEFSSL